MDLRFFHDPDTGLPHLSTHGVTEDEAGRFEDSGQVVVTVPESLLPEIRRLVADHEGARS